ncbi:hypothetical protein TWF191_002442 [Orbilia oligospora]|uniref:Uncharacterized protein n=1 Tax=Orbilia oligospora TaxID=2813651 RepID=A0A7C8QZI1_ORBOL|nr:hypothetical protein TWF191_002442 [Orbilia oligospora]
MCLYPRRFLTPDAKWLEMALKDIEIKKDLPESHEDLGILLFACKRARGDVSLFQRLWNQKAFPEFIKWSGFGLPGYYLNESTPLSTNDESTLKLLLSLGFTGFKRALAFRAMLLENYSIMEVFLGHEGLIPSDRSSLPGPGDSCGHRHVWEMLGIPMFYEIVAQFVATEIVPYHTSSRSTLKTLSPTDFKLALDYNINRVLVWAACINPEITEYIIQVMKWANAALTESEVVKLAIELLPCWPGYSFVLNCAIVLDDLGLVEVLLEAAQRLNLYTQEHSDEVFFPEGLLCSERFLYMYSAAMKGPSALKCLMRFGFDINESASAQSELHGRTALYGALTSGNMDTLVFVIQSGADIYAPCGSYQSAIESAICKGRIDAVALILAVDPNCHYLALKAAEKTEYEYIAEYVRNWTPESSSVF